MTLVIPDVILVKKNLHETAVKPLIILNISIKSALLRRSSSDHRYNLASRCEYGFQSG